MGRADVGSSGVGVDSGGVGGVNRGVNIWGGLSSTCNNRHLHHKCKSPKQFELKQS